MKKITLISDKIKNNNFSYTGKGGFEAIVIHHKNDILIWLEELIPLQKQIDMLHEKQGVEFQKRNYTRILTKYFKKEYKEFVNVNILLRDADAIKDGFTKQTDVTNLYSLLVTNNYLKYPGRSDVYVDFDIFEEFILVYKDELGIEYISENKQKDDAISLENETIIEEHRYEYKNEEIIEEYNDENVQGKKENKEENYWTNLLLGKK